MLRDANHKHRWGVILAGGEGTRLRPLTQFIAGDDRPKQFCPLLGGKSLLSETKRRIARNVTADRTLFVLLNLHERFYNSELIDVAPANLVVQPSNRGTLPAILYSLMLIDRLDQQAVVGLFPSDHHYTEEGRFAAGVDMAFEAAEQERDSLVLLGVAAREPEVDYGWIEAEPTISRSNHTPLKVKRFWEKPSRRQAEDLLDRGCIWNTFVMVGRARAFLDVIRTSAPELYRVFEMNQLDASGMEALYKNLPTTDFSKLVLAARPERLSVLCLGEVGWSDLGDPQRVINTLAETGVKSEWMSRWNHRAAAASAA